MSRKDYEQSDKMKTCPDCGGPAIFCHSECKKANQQKETSERNRKIKANELIVERLRKFFDGPNFVQADLTRDAFYEIITAAKLEANGHKEQRR